MNVKNRKHTKKKHLEISEEADKVIKNIVQSLNKELQGKYYQWQIIDIAVRLLEKQILTMDVDRKQELLRQTME